MTMAADATRVPICNINLRSSVLYFTANGSSRDAVTGSLPGARRGLGPSAR